MATFKAQRHGLVLMAGRGERIVLPHDGPLHAMRPHEWGTRGMVGFLCMGHPPLFQEPCMHRQETQLSPRFHEGDTQRSRREPLSAGLPDHDHSTYCAESVWRFLAPTGSYLKVLHKDGQKVIFEACVNKGACCLRIFISANFVWWILFS